MEVENPGIDGGSELKGDKAVRLDLLESRRIS